MEIRKIIDEIDKTYNKQDNETLYNILNRIVISLEIKYNLQKEEIIKQLKMILESLKKEV